MGAGRFVAPVESSAQASRRRAFLRSEELRQAFPLASLHSLSYHFRFSRCPLTLLGRRASLVSGCIQLKRVQAPSRILLGSRWKCSFLDLVDTHLHTGILLFKRYIRFVSEVKTHTWLLLMAVAMRWLLCSSFDEVYYDYAIYYCDWVRWTGEPCVGRRLTSWSQVFFHSFSSNPIKKFLILRNSCDSAFRLPVICMYFSTWLHWLSHIHVLKVHGKLGWAR